MKKKSDNTSNFLLELNDLFKKYDVKQAWGWDTGEIIVALPEQDVSISYNYVGSDNYLHNSVSDRIENLEVWK